MVSFIVDVREHNELKEKYLKSNKEDIVVLHIAMSNIEVYKEKIIEIAYNKGNVYLVCRSGNRAGSAKSFYFPHVNNIQSIGSVENASKTFNIDLIINQV